MLASFVDLSLLKTLNLLNLWLHVTPRSLRRLRASQGLIPGSVCWKWRNFRGCLICHKMLDLGSVNAPPPLDHRQSGVGWSRATVDCFEDRDPSTPRKEFMAGKFRAESIQMLINHWRWLQVNGSKQQAASCKLQAASLTRKNYRIIREYESKRSKKNN